MKRRTASLLFAAAINFAAPVFASPPYPPPPLPVINTGNIFNVTNAPYNAKPDGVTTDTTAIQNAINAATAASGGGTVELPGPGTYLCGPLTLKSTVNLQVDAGATLLMLPKSSWPGGTFISGSSLTDVEISGSGTIDGQGAGWWGGGSRPNFIQIDNSRRLLIQNVTLQNPPTFTIFLKNSDSDVTIQGINIDTVSTSPNTDGMDISSTNMLIQNSHISDGDDNIEIGGSGALAAWITVTNCVFGYGHGVSLGSDIGGGVHDVIVINCIFTNTQNGIKIKSDNDRGGLVQNLFYYNLSMTNLVYSPITIFSYYNVTGANPTSKGITPSVAASEAVAGITGMEPAYNTITISNITATAAQPGMIWGRTEYPATNIFLSKLNITATDSSAGDGSFAIYNARGVQVSDSTITVAGSRKTFELFDAQVVFSNSATGGSSISLDGLSVTNPLAFYNLNANFSDATFFDATPISLGAGTLSDGTGLTLSSTTPVNFSLGASAATIAVTGNLTLNSTLNITNGAGFVPGTYTLFTYTGSLGGSPTLGTLPTGYSGSLNTATAGQVNVVITSTNAPLPQAPTNLVATAGNALVTLTWSPSATATNYNVKRSLTNGGSYILIGSTVATNYTDLQVTNGVTYYYVVSAVNTNGEGANSVQVQATPQAPQPPQAPTNLVATAGNALVTLTWSPSATATNYNVKRSLTNGGSYIFIGSTVMTNYADSHVTNGVTYYYVVSAVNSVGEGSNSVQVSATPQSSSTNTVITTNIFTDVFSTSTLDSVSPAAPTATNTSYELLSSKPMSPNPGIASGHLQFGIGTTSSGIIEAEALFAGSPVTLASNGNSISLIVTFTNTSGLLTESGALGFGLLHSGQNYPVPGGLSNTLSGSITTHATGNAQTWVGYVGQISFTGAASQIMTRPAQTGADNNNQDCVSTGSSSSYSNPAGATVGTASTAPSLTLVAGNPYTEVLMLTRTAASALAITNYVYSGVNTNGTLLSQFGGVASGTTYLTNSFDALAIGWRAQANTFATAIDINSIMVNATLSVTASVATASVTLTNLNQTYDGNAHAVTASTTPPGLNVQLTYNGSANAPTNAGSYTVIGTVSDPNYVGSATNTLVINQATAVVTLTNLNQNYDGNAHAVTASTTPPGLNVQLTYNGNANAPTNIGSYTVVGTVNDPNYAGSATNTLVIGPSLTSPNVTSQVAGGQLQLSWPQDHLGWRLQIQTNGLTGGLGTNWVTVPNSTNSNSFNLNIDPATGSVFLRLIYP